MYRTQGEIMPRYKPISSMMTAVLASLLAITRGEKIISYPHDTNSWQSKIYQNSGYKKKTCVCTSIVQRGISIHAPLEVHFSPIPLN